MTTAPTTLSVVIITYARPDYVRTCLEHLRELERPASEVLVVDASPDVRTRELVTRDFPEALYLRNDLGPGTMPESRQIGLAHARGDIVAFIDDDAFVEPSWATELLTPYADPTVWGVGGRAVNGLPGEESMGLGQIGRLLPNGMLTGYFGADPGRDLDVDHLLGATMSFRRDTLTSIGGIRGNYPGTCLCEESDISLRVRAAGGRLVFAPRAVVHHVAAPYDVGQRFDRRYLYYARRNHVVLLARNFGFGAPLLRRYVRTTLRAQRQHIDVAVRRLRGDEGRSPTDRARALVVLTRAVVELVGLVVGFPAAVVARRRDRIAGVGTP